jgi:hypothetical protein
MDSIGFKGSGSEVRKWKPPKADLNSPRLIALVSKYPVIWDYNLEEYKDIGARHSAWESIASFFHDATRQFAFHIIYCCRNTWMLEPNLFIFSLPLSCGSWWMSFKMGLAEKLPSTGCETAGQVLQVRSGDFHPAPSLQVCRCDVILRWTARQGKQWGSKWQPKCEQYVCDELFNCHVEQTIHIQETSCWFIQ